jgi:hypothetical protein
LLLRAAITAAGASVSGGPASISLIADTLSGCNPLLGAWAPIDIERRGARVGSTWNTRGKK